MYIDLLIVLSGVLLVSAALWTFVRAGAQSEKARNRAAVRARLEELGKVKTAKFGGWR